MIIVTGGAGFIGSNTVKYLNSKGISDIIIIDDLSDGRKFENLKDLEFTEYQDVDSFDVSKFSITKVFHIGGISSTTETDGKKLMWYNYEHTKRWYDFCVKGDIPLIYTSSASVYGNSQTFEEGDTVDPLNAYAYSKHMSEKYIISNGCKNTWIFRPFNVYGDRERFKYDQSSPVYKFEEQQKIFGYVNIFEGSENIFRDFICVDDVVKIMVDHTEKMSGLYNLGTGQTDSFYNIAHTISDDVRVVPFPENLKNRYQYYSKADTGKLRQIIQNYKFIVVSDFLNA